MTLNSKANASDLVARIRGEGVSLWEENGKLRYRAPQGMLADSDLQKLKEYKEDILVLLQAKVKPAPVEYHLEARYEPFPLTDVQSAYLLGRSEVFEYGGVACHIYLELNYPELEYSRTGDAWNELVLRHDMLRAIINKNGYQQVLEKTPRLEVAYTDAGAWGKDRAEAKLKEIREEMGHRRYTTDCWPLFGVAVTKTPDHSVLHFSIEFLIADWASIWRLLSEFESLYYHPEQKLPDFQLSFRDYLLAERGLRESDVYARDRDYWFRRLDDLPPAPELPLTKIRNSSGKARFSRWFLQLDIQSWDRFKQKAHQRGLTPTSAVMAAYAAVLERWSRNKKFCLNLTVLNRLPLDPQVNDIVGDFTSVSLLAVDWHAGNSLGEQAKLMSKQLFDDLDHRLFSGVEVIREISRRRGREAALMPIVFTSAIGLVGATKGSQLKGMFEGRGISQTPQVFIDCQAMDGPAGLQVNWDIREGVFPDRMPDDMFDAFAGLLHQLADTDKAWDSGEVVPLPAWQFNERKQINDTKAPLPEELLHSKILNQAEAAPDRTAVIDSQGRVTYGELMLSASAVAEKLKETGCQEQDRVAVIMDKSVHQVAAVLGALSAGAVYVPIDVAQPDLRRMAMLEKTKIRHVLTCSAVRIKWPENITAIEVDKLQPHRQNTLRSDGDPDLPAYIIHTSGSTGQPKGVVITHRAAANTITDINSRFNISPDDRLLGLAQLSFDLSVYDIFGILSAGGTLIYPSADKQNDPSHWAKLMVDHEVTVWNSVPALMQMLVACLHSDHNIFLKKLRLVMLSGDWIPLTLPDMVPKYAPAAQVVSLGGATEASIWSIFHLYRGVQPDWSSIPYGRPLANQAFRVLDEKLRDCPVWAPGELYIAGTGLAEGYFADKETTKDRFLLQPVDGQRLYRTGDLGRYRPGGEIEFLGRSDTQVKIRGHRIELGEIESTLLKHSAVTAAVVVVEGASDNKALTGIVEMTCFEQDCIPALVSELTDFLAKRLPAHMIPARLHIVDALPLTGNGKIDRRELAKWSAKAITKHPTAAIDEESFDILEAQIARLWAEALSIPRIGKLQNFYDHGADSLIMAQVAGKLRDKMAEGPLQVKIPFDALFRQMLNYPTVAALAEFIRSYRQEAESTPDVPTAGNQGKTGNNAVLTSYGGEETGPLRVVFHAVLGTMDSFRPLLKQLTAQKLGPVVGITIADIEQYCIIESAELIETVADDYAGRLLETGNMQMQLIGYSFGGLIAIEVARRLLERGIHILDLVLIEVPPTPAVDDDILLETMFVPHLNITLEQAGFGRVDQADLVRGGLYIMKNNGNCVPQGSSGTIGGHESLNKVGDLCRRLATLSMRERFTSYVKAIDQFNGEPMPVEIAEGLFKVYRQNFKAARFTPPAYMGDIRLLMAREPYDFLPGINETTLDFWQAICLGEVAVQEIAGNHLTCIEAESNVSDLAKVIGEVFVKK
ncbi:non-ribosomal peptide synthetase [Sporomusa sp. KB1]|jgi:pyochelin synthetase|uniref:non-ribosomal peptide synthetase n=1 Tax=Sporomusa sp. KB1 TaxID=943346 RepID=UPI0011A4CAAF|nr:non-ribosomal peptide synthetase [Sporomusa sp. KB1]TWH46113.1 pyochelin synthetase [Sporomusa sp. KB1]